MNASFVNSAPEAAQRAASASLDVLGREEHVEAVAMSIDEQLLVLSALFPKNVMLLVAAALILPARVQEPQVEEGRRVAESARSGYFRFVEALSAVARIRDGRRQGAELTQALDQAGLDLEGVMQFAAERERACPGCVQRVADEAQRFIRAKLAEGRKRQILDREDHDWDFVLGEWSTRHAILVQGHALPGLDGYVPRMIHAEDDWQ